MIFAFDEWQLDTELFELRHDGVVRKVEPQVFDLLHFLVRNHERVVSKGEIVEEIWDGRIVSEATISTCLKAARQALDDDGRLQRMIRTVHGRGFRFVGTVKALTEEPLAEEPLALELLALELLADELRAGHVQAEAPPPQSTPEPIADAPMHKGLNAPDLAEATGMRKGPAKPVIAVLPFDNLSGDLDAYFADGLTEDIITNLSRFRELLVVGRTTSFQFKGRRLALTKVCEELNAGYIVEGSVRRAGSRIRITAQLIDGVSGIHIWADSYDREMEDIFAVQDEVTRTIAARLGVSMQDVALQRAMKKSATELDAYDCVLRARRYSVMMNPELHAEARDLLERAVMLDPSSADAKAFLANVYLAEHRVEANPRPNPIERALDMAQQAVQLDPQNAYARCWLAIVHFFQLENEAFEAEANRALALNPNDPEILADLGHYFTFMGAFERGYALSRRAQELNPLHPGWYRFSFTRYSYHKRDYRRALAEAKRIAMPDFYWTHVLIAACMGQLGRPEAASALAQALKLKPDFSAYRELKKWNADPDDMEHLVEGLRKAGLQEAA
ncbi:MAG: winged helix-turn-helix domain-containing protein [Kiloniellales bacterium]